MRITLNINDELMSKASKLTGISEKTALVFMGLKALISQESAKHLARLGGSEPKAVSVKRRR
jgi:Arc/MetJ family transcription regulator